MSVYLYASVSEDIKAIKEQIEKYEPSACFYKAGLALIESLIKKNCAGIPVETIARLYAIDDCTYNPKLKQLTEKLKKDGLITDEAFAKEVLKYRLPRGVLI